MHRLTQRDDQGVVAVLSAIALTALLAISALVLDAGNAYTARQQARASADSAVLAKALDCINGTTTPLGPYMVQGSYVDDTHPIVCDSAANKVTVWTAKDVSFGVARVVGKTGATAHASATARWGRFSLGTSVPLAISICDFQSHPIIFHGGAHCNRGPSGQDVAGGFGWLDKTLTCTATRNADGTYGGDTGRPDKTACDWKSFVDNQTEISIVVFNKVVETGSHATYTVAGFAHYVIKGYSFNISGPHSWPDAYGTLAGGCPGGSGVDCIDGVFKGFTQSQGDLLPGPCNVLLSDMFACKISLSS